MKLGLTTYSLHNKDFREQLSSLLKNDIRPDFIIVHYRGVNRIAKAFNFLKRTITQYKFKSLSYISSRKSDQAISLFKPSIEEEKEIDNFLTKAKIISAGNINSTSTIALIKNLGECIIVCNSGRLNAEVLNISEAIFLNVHASKLPAYRGMNNVEWALWESKEIWCSIHRISKGIDEGDILLQEKIETADQSLTTIAQYRQYSFFKSNELIGKAMKEYLDKKLNFTKQEISGSLLDQYYVMHPILKVYLEKKLSGK